LSILCSFSSQAGLSKREVIVFSQTQYFLSLRRFPRHTDKKLSYLGHPCPSYKKGEKMEKENLCACGARCFFTVRVKYPNGRVVAFCDYSCSAYKAEKKQADKAWKSFRARKAQNEKNGQLGRQQALAAKAAKPKPGSPEAQKVRNEREQRRVQLRADRLDHRPIGRSN